VSAGTYANAALISANSAYGSQNTTGTYANAAYTQANTATTNAATADSKAVTAGTYANSAYTQANTATTNAATADSKAVTAGVYANSAFEVANSSGLYANASYLKANSAYGSQNTAGTYANAAYTQANTATTNASIADSKAVTAGTYANAALISANSAYGSQNTTGTYANSAFLKANNALANSTGTFAGDLTITGNTHAQKVNTGNLTVIGTSDVSGNANFTGIVNVTGAVNMNATLVLSNSNFSTTEVAFRITAAGSSQTPTQAGTLIQLTGKQNTPARMLIDSFGTSNASYSLIAGRSARGTVDAPTATQNNDILLRIAGNSYGNTGYAPFGDARIDFVATENHTDTARGSRIRFWNTPNGSNVVNEIASFNADSVYFTGVVSPEKGFIYAPTVLPGSQTAFTIDFSTTSLIKASIAADLTISLSNYIYGKVVEVWITNTGGAARTVTHGCTATNSTLNSTTFTMSGTSSAYLRYFSIDGDNANTFVTVQYN
jgi:hypothetical protein